MKRLVIIVAVLIVLVSLIGFERMGQGLRFLVSDDRTARARMEGRAASTEVTKTGMPSAEESESSRMVSRSDKQVPGNAIVSPPITEHSGRQSDAVRITGEIAPMHFVRASSIIGDPKATKDQIDRLREALAVIGDALRPSAVIFDMDGFSTSQAPVLLFARDEFDLTARVKAIYDQLEQASIHPAE